MTTYHVVNLLLFLWNLKPIPLLGILFAFLLRTTHLISMTTFHLLTTYAVAIIAILGNIITTTTFAYTDLYFFDVSQHLLTNSTFHYILFSYLAFRLAEGGMRWAWIWILRPFFDLPGRLLQFLIQRHFIYQSRRDIRLHPRWRLPITVNLVGPTVPLPIPQPGHGTFTYRQYPIRVRLCRKNTVLKISVRASSSTTTTP